MYCTDFIHFYGDVMNIGAISSYVALVCLLTFLAMTGGLHAQTTTQSAVKVKKAKVIASSPVVVDVNSEVTTDGDENGEHVIAITQEGKDGQPRKLVVKRLVANGKETILLNGREVNENDKELPKDVEQLLEDMKEGSNMVIQLNGSRINTGGPNSKSRVMVWNGSPKCDQIHVEINGLDSLHTMMSMNSEDMKKRCEEMKQQLGKMKENMKFRMDTLRTKVWTMNNGEVPMQVRVMNLDSVMPSQIFVYQDGEQKINVTVPEFKFDFDVPMPPDMPLIREFETDDLGDIATMLDVPEPPDVDALIDASNGVQKRYKVIIIEHPGGKDEVEINDDEMNDDTMNSVQSEEAAVEQPSRPTKVDEINTLRAEYFNVFPNPTPGMLNISFALEQSGGAVTVTVTDLLGNKVFDETLQNYSGQYHRQIDLADKARGTYIVNVSRDGQTLSRQVAVR
jgi:hypothetical protein